MTSRFEVGGAPVLTLHMTSDQPTLMGLARPFLWGRSELPEKITFFELTVREEHAVAWSEDPQQEKKYKGYKLSDSQGRMWTNQFPYAHYGQLSTEADYFFEREKPEDVEIREFLDAENENPYAAIQFTKYMDELRGLFSPVDFMGMSKPAHHMSGERLAMFRDFYDRIWVQFNGEFPELKLKYEKTYIDRTNPNMEPLEYWRHLVVPAAA